MSESDKALTPKDVAQFLEMSTSAAHGVLQLMEVFKIVQKVKRGRSHYFVLKDVYDDEQIEAMLPPKKVGRRSIYDPMIDQFLESGHSLVEMTVENRKANYVRNILRNRISERGLEEQVKALYVDEWVYLEKVE
ncbi:unnamed protein product [marine sediment metagenome]|uniref:Uncharacterized protein n=1 Tax=marine sediment metagenome TaxID=412755 RepID=X1BSA6_9ZZZZ